MVDGRTTEHAYTISSPMSLKTELKMQHLGNQSIFLIIKGNKVVIFIVCLGLNINCLYPMRKVFTIK